MILVTLILMAISTVSYSKECKIDVIPEAKIEYGCGCGYYKVSNNKYKTVFQSEIDYSQSRMFINKKLTYLKIKNLEPAPSKVGEKFIQVFKLNNKEYKFSNIVSFVCSPNRAGCEVTRFDSVLSINNSCTIKLKGDCGC